MRYFAKISFRVGWSTMRPAIVDNADKDVELWAVSSGVCHVLMRERRLRSPEKSALQLQEPVLPNLRKETHRPVDRKPANSVA